MGNKKIPTGAWARFEKGNAGYDEYMGSEQWRKKASKRMEMDGHRCQVCGEKATEVHHLTYDSFRREKMEDLVSLCHRCHEKAESIYQPAITPWSMDEVKPDGNNFMAALRVDAVNIAHIVYNYLMEVRGIDFRSIMELRQPPKSADNKHYGYWLNLRNAVNALCRKRYSLVCIEDRRILMLGSIENHVEALCLSEIEHWVKNELQADLHDAAAREYKAAGTQAKAAKELGVSAGTLNRLIHDDGTSFGPSLREAVLTCCATDAAYGIRPVQTFSCLSDEDYAQLNSMADYIASVSGDGAFRGEYANQSEVYA